MNINVNNELKKVREKEINDILEYAECGLTVKEIVEVTNYDITYVNDIIKNSPLQINEVTTNYKQVAKDIQKMMKKDRMKFISTKDIQDYVDNNADSPHKVEIDRIESELKKLRVSVVDKFPQRREELDKEDEPTVQKVVQMLKKASKAHAGQAKELEKAVKEEIDEQFSKSMIDKLRKTYGPLKGKKIPPEPLAKIFDKIDRNKNALIQLYKADIPFVSMMAMSRLMLKHNYKASDINKLGKIRMEDFVEEVELDENRYMRGGVRLSFDDDRFGGKKMMIQIGTDTLDVPNSQIKNFLKLIRGLSDSEFK